jgi:hypothetical protein
MGLWPIQDLKHNVICAKANCIRWILLLRFSRKMGHEERVAVSVLASPAAALTWRSKVLYCYNATPHSLPLAFWLLSVLTSCTFDVKSILLSHFQMRCLADHTYRDRFGQRFEHRFEIMRVQKILLVLLVALSSLKVERQRVLQAAG